MKKDEKVLIIGAGLAGSLLAIKMAQQGYEVEVHEKLPDLRKKSLDARRSINLALSDRGLRALKDSGAEKEILELCIPMYARSIHGTDGETRNSPYSGREGEKINSISRPGLNSVLLNAAESYENVSIRFNSRCTTLNIEDAVADFVSTQDGKKFKISADVILGSDGAGSTVRKSLMARTPQLLFNYSQKFLRSGYKELEIPPSKDGGYKIEKNVLHIWPRGKFMMIALPNLDGSFTVTMFHPYEGEGGFNTLDSEEKLLCFFKKYYPDTLAHFPDLAAEYFDNPVGILGTTKCYPWQAYGKTMILGDAAHPIVPFYGQGMNASLEDVRLFDETLKKNTGNWAKTFTEFQDLRKENTDAIADLAIDNFYEMQDKVADEIFIKKRKLEMQLEQTFTDYYSKYSLVTFQENLPYSEAMRRGRRQDELLLEICQKSNFEEIPLDEIYNQLKQIV